MKQPKIYLASSWRNEHQPKLVHTLRAWGYRVYDFRNPPNKSGFGWEQICDDWQQWDLAEYTQALRPRYI